MLTKQIAGDGHAARVVSMEVAPIPACNCNIRTCFYGVERHSGSENVAIAGTPAGS